MSLFWYASSIFEPLGIRMYQFCYFLFLAREIERKATIVFSSQQLYMVKEIKKLVQKEQNPYFTWRPTSS
jgi:hypothetical protein